MRRALTELNGLARRQERKKNCTPGFTGCRSGWKLTGPKESANIGGGNFHGQCRGGEKTNLTFHDVDGLRSF